MIRPEPCTQVPALDHSTMPPTPLFPPGTRCYLCGHMWVVHTTEHAYRADGVTSPGGCTQCQSEREVMDEILSLLGQAFPEFRS